MVLVVNCNVIERFYLQAPSSKLLQIDESSRPAMHAALVKETCLLIKEDATMISALASLLHLPFPNLRSLSLHVGATVPSVLFQPPLHKIQIWFSSSNTQSFLDATLLIKTATGNLESLTLSIGTALPPDAYEEVSRAIDANPSLRELTIADNGDTYQMAFEAASRLQHLTKLSFFSDYIRDGDPVLQPAFGFPTLTKFKADIAANSVATFLRSLSTPLLQELDLCSNSSTADNGVDLSDVSRFSELRVFDYYVDSPNQVWQGMLLPLLSCSKLEVLTLYEPTVAEKVDDDMIQRMGQAWPSLHSLILACTGRRSEERPTATLRGVACLAELCPGLAKLTIAVDASVRPERQYIVGSAVEILDISGSYADEKEDLIADLFCQMWPKLRGGSRTLSGNPDKAWDGIRQAITNRLG